MGRKKRLTIRYSGSIPDTFDETFSVRVAYFKPTAVRLRAKGIFPQVVVDLPRDLQHDPDYKPRMNYAVDTVLMGMARIDECELSELSRGTTPQITTGKTTASRRTIVPVRLTTEQFCARECDRLSYYDHCMQSVLAVRKGKKRLAATASSARFALASYLVDFGHVILGSKKTVTFAVTNVGVMPALVEIQKRDFADTMFRIDGPSPVGLPPEHTFKLRAICAPTQGHDAPVRKFSGNPSKSSFSNSILLLLLFSHSV